MRICQLNQSKKILLVNVILLCLFAIIAGVGLLDLTEESLSSVIEKRPLPKAYFPCFFILGFLYPLLLRLFHRNKSHIREFLDSYLILLGGQILSEILLVVMIGKGLGVIPGLIFSILRLVQLRQENEKVLHLNYFTLFIRIQFILWAINIIQITTNRIIPWAIL